MHKPTTLFRHARWLAAASLFMLGACTQTTSQQRYSDEQIQHSRTALQSVRESYDSGNYGDVITRVARDDRLHEAPSDIRVEALKLQAFSLCMRNYAAMCKERFQTILSLQPDFDLSDGERGHPQWGPVFEQAKQVQ